MQRRCAVEKNQLSSDKQPDFLLTINTTCKKSSANIFDGFRVYRGIAGM